MAPHDRVSRRTVLETVGAAGLAAAGVGASASTVLAAEDGDDFGYTNTVADEGSSFAFRNVQLTKPAGDEDEDRTERPVVPGDEDYKEPQIVADAAGNLYVGAIRGLADGGSDMWRSSDGGDTWEYIGQPEQVPVATEQTGNGLGGGDIAMDTGAPYDGSGTEELGETGNLYAASLWLGSIYFSTSADGGETWETVNPLSSVIAGVDRQWIAPEGQQTVYMSYHDVYTFGIDVVKSTDGGRTWRPAAPATPVTDPENYAKAVVEGNQLGNIRAPGDGTVYQVWVAPEDLTASPEGQPNDTVYLSVSNDGARSWEVNTVYVDDAGHSLDHIFPVVDVDEAGNVYAAWSDNDDVYYAASTDGGHTWTDRVQVNSGDGTTTSIFPWVAAGADGVLNVTWYATKAEDNTVEDAKWHVYFTQVRDAVTDPVVEQMRVTDHPVRKGKACQGGAGCTGGRQLTDVFYMTVDPDGRAHISYTDDSDVGEDADDSADGRQPDQQSFVASQTSGPSSFETLPSNRKAASFDEPTDDDDGDDFDEGEGGSESGSESGAQEIVGERGEFIEEVLNSLT